MTIDVAGESVPSRRTGGRGLETVLRRLGAVDARATWPIAVGALMVPLGIVIILLAWYGSAHTPYIQQQIPYLVSGSFIGLGLMVLGGLMYWAHWLYRIYDQAHLQHEIDARRQEELFAQLIDAVRTNVPPSPAGRVATVPTEIGTDLVATATGSNAHRPDCPIVRRHPAGLRALTIEQARAARPCRICHAAVPDDAR